MNCTIAGSLRSTAVDKAVTRAMYSPFLTNLKFEVKLLELNAYFSITYKVKLKMKNEETESSVFKQSTFSIHQQRYIFNCIMRKDRIKVAVFR